MEPRRALSRWSATTALALTAAFAATAAPAAAAPNIPPIPLTASFVMNEDAGPRAVTLFAVDPNGDPLTYTIVDAPDHGVLSGTGASRSYTPDPDFAGSDAFTYRVSDGRGGTAQQRVSITVLNVNDAPTVAPSPYVSAYTIGGPPVLVDPNLAVTDPDSPLFLSASVRVSAGFQPGDVLTVTPAFGLLTSYNPATGVLSIFGVASQSTYVTVLRSVRFSTSSTTPGSRTIRYAVTDLTGLTGQATRTLPIVPLAVNDPPVNTVPASLTTDEDEPASLAGFAVADPDAGSGDVQTTLSAAHGVFEVDPSASATVTGNGTSTTVITGTIAEVNAALAAAAYRPDPDYAGSDTITIVTDDLGNTGAGGPLSDTDAVPVTVAPVTDAPDLTQPDATPLAYTEDDPSEDHAAVVVPNLAIDYDDGTTLTGATVRLDGNAPGDELVFTDQNGITGTYDAGTGTLTLTGTASVADYQAALRSVRFRTTSEDPSETQRTVEVQVADGAAESDVVTRAIDVVATNDGPTADDESFTGASRAVGNTSLVVDDPTDGAPDPAGPQKTVSGNVLDGDTDPDDDAGDLTVVPGTFATTGGGTVTIEADGDFTYLPDAGCTDTTDAFDYTVTDGDATDTGTVELTIADCVWYVDANAAPPPADTAGTSQTPLASLDALDGAGGSGDLDTAGDRIFLHDGSYGGGLTLESDQQVLSERHGLTVPDGGSGTTTLQPAAPAAPASRIDDGVTAATGNTLQGVDLGTASGFALSGTSVGALTVNTETSGALVNPSGGAVSIGGTGNALAVAFSELSSTGGANGVTLTNATGTFTAASGTIADATGADLALDGGTLDLTLGASIVDDAGPLVTIANTTGGTKDLNGLVTDAPADGDGGGVQLTGNTGATIRFDGGLNLSTGATDAFTATGGGTVAVTDPAGGASATLDTTTGTALRVTAATIHPDDLTFERIASSGAPNGVVLNGTGAAGGLTVTGAGGACTAATPTCTGGLIQGSTGAGIALTTVGGGVDLTAMRIAGGQDDGVRATAVSGLRLQSSLVTGNGNAAQERGLDLEAVTGAAVIADSRVSGSAGDNVRLANVAGSVDLDVTASTVASSAGGDGLLVSGGGTAAMKADVTGSTFQGNRDDGLQLTTAGANTAAMQLNFNGNTVTADATQVAAGALVTVSPAGSSQTRVAMDANTLDTSRGAALILAPTGSAQFDATVTGNQVLNAGAIGIWGTPGQNASSRMRIADNTIQGYRTNGMVLRHGEGGGNASYLVHGNTVSAPAANAFEGLIVEAGASSSDTVTVCADIGGPGALANDLGSAGGSDTFSDDVVFARYAGSQLQLPGLAGDLETYIRSRNTGNPTVVSYGPLDPTAGPACTAPTLPAAP